MCVFNVHSLTYSLDQHPLIHDIHFPPVDARFVLGSGNAGSRETVVNWARGHRFRWGKVCVLCARGGLLPLVLGDSGRLSRGVALTPGTCNEVNRAPGEEREVRSGETLDPRSLWCSWIQGAPWMAEWMVWRGPRPVSSKVAGGVTGRGNCRTRAPREQLSAQLREPWPEPRPRQGEQRMHIEEAEAIGFGAGVRGAGWGGENTTAGYCRVIHGLRFSLMKTWRFRFWNLKPTF